MMLMRKALMGAVALAVQQPTFHVSGLALRGSEDEFDKIAAGLAQLEAEAIAHTERGLDTLPEQDPADVSDEEAVPEGCHIEEADTADDTTEGTSTTIELAVDGEPTVADLVDEAAGLKEDLLTVASLTDDAQDNGEDGENLLLGSAAVAGVTAQAEAVMDEVFADEDVQKSDSNSTQENSSESKPLLAKKKTTTGGGPLKKLFGTLMMLSLALPGNALPNFTKKQSVPFHARMFSGVKSLFGYGSRGILVDSADKMHDAVSAATKTGAHYAFHPRETHSLAGRLSEKVGKVLPAPIPTFLPFYVVRNLPEVLLLFARLAKIDGNDSLVVVPTLNKLVSALDKSANFLQAGGLFFVAQKLEKVKLQLKKLIAYLQTQGHGYLEGIVVRNDAKLQRLRTALRIAFNTYTIIMFCSVEVYDYAYNYFFPQVSYGLLIGTDKGQGVRSFGLGLNEYRTEINTMPGTDKVLHAVPALAKGIATALASKSTLLAAAAFVQAHPVMASATVLAAVLTLRDTEKRRGLMIHARKLVQSVIEPVSFLYDGAAEAWRRYIFPEWVWPKVIDVTDDMFADTVQMMKPKKWGFLNVATFGLARPVAGLIGHKVVCPIASKIRSKVQPYINGGRDSLVLPQGPPRVMEHAQTNPYAGLNRIINRLFKGGLIKQQGVSAYPPVNPADILNPTKFEYY